MKVFSRLVTMVILGMPTGPVLSAELPFSFNMELGRQYQREVNSLVVPAHLLPAECYLAHDTNSAPIFPATTNPFVTDNPQLIGMVSAIGFGNRAIDQVRVALTALYVYQQPHFEVGVWGLRFTTPEVAQKTARALTGPQVWIRESLLVTVWQDDVVSQPCYDAILHHLREAGFVKRGIKP